MGTHEQPLVEVDRFFAAPPNRRPSRCDAQSEAIERLVLRCEQVRPQLHSTEALERFIARQHDPPRIRRRISLALAIETPGIDLFYGQIGRPELEIFRKLAERKLAAMIWVFA
jgi:hypothetical protein